MAWLGAGACGGFGTQAAPIPQPSPTVDVKTLMVQEMTRTYRVVVPPTLGAAKPLPLVLVLHGASSTAEEIAVTTGFDLVAVQEQVIVVYPNSSNERWYATGVGSIDDVLFIRTLIDRLQADYKIDPNRI